MFEFSTLIINNDRYDGVTGTWHQMGDNIYIETDDRSGARIFTMVLRNRVKIETIEFRREDNTSRGFGGPYLVRSIENNYITLSK
jgi:hypothetical protein